MSKNDFCNFTFKTRFAAAGCDDKKMDHFYGFVSVIGLNRVFCLFWEGRAVKTDRFCNL
jgi:hypothetical protein